MPALTLTWQPLHLPQAVNPYPADPWIQEVEWRRPPGRPGRAPRVRPPRESVKDQSCWSHAQCCQASPAIQHKTTKSWYASSPANSNPCASAAPVGSLTLKIGARGPLSVIERPKGSQARDARCRRTATLCRLVGCDDSASWWRFELRHTFIWTAVVVRHVA